MPSILQTAQATISAHHYSDSDEDHSSGLTARPPVGLVDVESYQHADELEDECESDSVDDGRVEVVQVPYQTIVRRSLLVPALALLCFGAIILLFTFAWPPSPHADIPYPHRPNLSSFLVGLAFLALSHSLRVPIATVLSPLPLSTPAVNRCSTAIHTLLLEILRLSSICIFLPPLEKYDHWDTTHALYPSVWDQQPAFSSAAWLGLGWSAGEVTVGIWQVFTQLRFYRPVLPGSYHSIRLEDEENLSALGLHTSLEQEDEESEGERERELLEEGVWELIAVQKREQIEAILGVPLPNIPVIISALWRIDSLLLSLGITLLLSAFYSAHRDDPSAFTHLVPLFTLVTAGHVGLSLAWVRGISTLGAPTTTYASLLVALAVFFWGLGSWEALV